MAHYPLMVTFRDVVSGNGFLAGVTLYGKALAVKEDDGKWWMYGVRPAAIAEWADTPQDAFSKFKARYKAVLFDFAEEVPDFAAFELRVKNFYSDPDFVEEERWTAALEAIRKGKTVVEPPFSDLPREAPETRPCSISVTWLNEVQRYTPSDNIADTFMLPKAA